MSLGLFAAAVVLLERHRFMSVERLADLLAVPQQQIRPMLTDMHNQGHCTLTFRGNEILSAAWCEQPKG